MRIDKSFFEKHQKTLVKLANSWLGRLVFQFEKMGHDLKSYGPISIIGQNYIAHNLSDGKIAFQFFGRNEYALKLRPYLFWVPTAELSLENAELILRPALIGLLLFLGDKVFPFLALTTYTYYPDAHPESTTVDGRVSFSLDESNPNAVWSFMQPWTGGDAPFDNNTTDYFARIKCATNIEFRWLTIARSIFLFDTSPIPDSYYLLSGIFSVYGYNPPISSLSGHSFNIGKGIPDSNTSLVYTDYNFTKFNSAFYSSDLSTTSWLENNYNAFALNSTGINAIDKTGITKIGGRMSIDIGDVAPDWNSASEASAQCCFADNGSNKPKLVIIADSTTTSSSTSSSTTVTTSSSTTLSTTTSSSTTTTSSSTTSSTTTTSSSTTVTTTSTSATSTSSSTTSTSSSTTLTTTTSTSTSTTTTSSSTTSTTSTTTTLVLTRLDLMPARKGKSVF